MTRRTARQDLSWPAAGRVAPASRRFVLATLLRCLFAATLPALAAPEGGRAPVGGQICAFVLAGQDASGATVFRTVALALDRPGLVVTPLHTLERGGVRWERLTIEDNIAAGRGGGSDAATLAFLDPSSDLAYLRVPGLSACAGEAVGPEPAAASSPPPGATLLVLREKIGYRPGAVGGRVERAVDLPDGRRLILARLLDAKGADPGIVLDAVGRFLGSVAPSPPGCDPALAAVVPAPPVPVPVEDEPVTSRPIPAPRPSSSFSGLLPGMVAEALLLAGSSRTEAALARLEEAMRRGGESGPLLLERGALHYASGQLPAAVADFTRASAEAPSSYLARFNLGVALGASGRYDDAAAAFHQARDLAPTNPRARFELALALRAADRGDEARGEWKSLDDLDPTLARELKLLLGF